MMFAWVGTLKIGTRILMGLFVPVFGMMVFASISMSEKYEASSELQHVRDIAELAPTLSNLVHELQKERGRSAGFIGSKGSTFADILPGQRTQTDNKRAEALAALDAFDFAFYGEWLEESSQAAIAALGKLDEMRQAVDRFDLTVPEMARYYTGTIMSLIATIEAMQIASSDDTVSKKISAYLSFLQGKERAGRERAMGAAGFSSGQFKPAIYNRFVQLIGAQDLLFSNFRLVAGAEEAAFYDQTMVGDAVEEVERLRKIALESPQTGSLGGITGAQWFESITSKIDLMKQVEDRVAEDLRAIAAEKQESAWSAFVVSGIVTLGLLLVVAITVLPLFGRSHGRWPP